jgi:hypothetical protein
MSEQVAKVRDETVAIERAPLFYFRVNREDGCTNNYKVVGNNNV